MNLEEFIEINKRANFSVSPLWWSQGLMLVSPGVNPGLCTHNVHRVAIKILTNKADISIQMEHSTYEH